MEIIQEIQNILTLLNNKKLTPNQFFLLYLLYSKEYNRIKDIFGVDRAIKIRNSLVGSPYLLSNSTTRFTETIISKNEIEKLLQIKGDSINFWEFYNCYPVKTGSRILRSAGPTAKKAIKHEAQYLKRVKTIEQHNKAIKSITAYVAKKKFEGKLQYLEMMDTIMNNCLWEDWEIFIKEEETKNWNYDDA